MALDVTIPQIGESVATVFISQWLVAPGDYVKAGDPVLEIDSDKASMEVPAPVDGTVVKQIGDEGDEVPVGSVFMVIDETATQSAAPSDATASSEDTKVTGDDVRAGPAARAAASAQGVDLQSVEGTGKGGRVTSNDVARAATPAATPAAVTTSSAAAAPEGRTSRVKMTPLRRVIARRLVEAQQEAAMLTTFNEVDMSAVMAMRKAYKQTFIDKHGIKLGFMSFFVKAAIEGLKAFPAVNAEVDGNEIVYKHFYDIGVAVSGPKGLVVPVIRDADQLSFAKTEGAIAELGVKARANKLRIDDLTGGTFTISNGGIFGSMMSTPILNRPQVGILGMHNIVQRAVVVDGEIVIRPMMYLALSYDHRIIDGREAVSFLVRIKQCIENPERILLEV
jgi:2-oxoglutarate dehydrogenase E2 component (dihydrolipoamide succinyltransferase)